MKPLLRSRVLSILEKYFMEASIPFLLSIEDIFINILLY